MNRLAILAPLIGAMVATCAITPSPTPAPAQGTPSPPSVAVTTSIPPTMYSAQPARTDTAIPSPSLAVGSTNPESTIGWPIFESSGQEDSPPVFGPDGRVYVLRGWRGADEYQQTVVALDVAGHVISDWPINNRQGFDFGSLAVGPDGSVHFEECGGPGIGCVVHRLDITGRELAGWPSQLPRDFACPNGGLCGSILGIRPDGTFYLSHWRDIGGQQVIRIDASGEVMPGWPVVPDALAGWWSNPQIGSDGALFMLGVPDGRATPARLVAYDRDGTLRSGWPVTVPDRSNYLLGPDGTVVVWSLIDDRGELCNEPRRTLFNVLGSDGRTLPGWPRGSQGYASEPVVDGDGTVYYVSALGNVYAHDRTGEVKAGWPVSVPGAVGWCGRLQPNLAPDGTIYVLGHDEQGRGEVTGLSKEGLSLPGWPYHPAGTLVGPPYDSEGGGTMSPPVFGSDGTVYFVVFPTDTRGPGVDVVAVDRSGHIQAGWPYRLPIDPTAGQVASLTLAPDGRLFVRGGGMLLALDPDGRLSQ